MSSFFDEASLVMIPSGYKDQKVYSVKPLDGSGDLTFSRASSATRVASNGLIEKVRTNLVLQSQAFDTADWAKAAISVTANSVANPLDAVINADTIVATAGTTQKYIGATNIFSGQFTFSVYAKYVSQQFVQVFLGADAGFYANFDIQNGTASAVGGATASIVSVGSGWYRLSMSFTSVIGSGIYLLNVDSLAATRFVTTSTTNSYYAFGAQIETGDIATDYIATTSAAVSVGPVSGLPRLDYLNSTCPRLLLEPQRTNVALFSEQFTNAVWINQTSNTTITKVASSTAPDGYSFTRLVTTGSGGQGRLVQLLSGSETSLTYSIYVRGTGTTQLNLFMSGGGNFTGPVVTLTNNWQRISISGTRASGSTGDFEIRTFGGNTLEVYGAQVEAGAYATSYIPTLGTSVTRVADAALTGSVPSLIGQTAGTIFWQGSVDYRQSGDGHALALSGSASSFGDAILLYRQSSNGHLAIYIQIGGANQFATPLTYNDISSISENDKYAIAYANNDLVVYKNGVQIISASSGSIPACNYFLLNEWNNTYVNTNITKQAILFPTRLSNSDLAALTA
jgi:hypothetical protein